MKIALVVPTRSDPAHRRAAESLARELKSLGHEAAVLVGARALKLGLKRADVCHVQFFSRGLGWLGRFRFPPGIKIVLTHQGADLSLLERPGAFARLLRRADWATAVSRHGLRELRSRYPWAARKSSWVPNGFSPAPGASAAGSRRPFALSVGRLAAYKGSDVLAMAFASVARSLPKLDLAICGPDQTGGRFSAFLSKLGLSSRVRCLGTTPPARISRLLHDCLFFVLPSRRENCPMALIEAMGAGKAVLASAVGGVPELVHHGATGLLVKPGRPRPLAQAMLRLARDNALRARLGRNAREASRAMTWRRAASDYLRIYKGTGR